MPSWTNLNATIAAPSSTKVYTVVIKIVFNKRVRLITFDNGGMDPGAIPKLVNQQIEIELTSNVSVVTS
jgi:hypothetical protein